MIRIRERHTDKKETVLEQQMDIEFISIVCTICSSSNPIATISVKQREISPGKIEFTFP